MNSEPVYPIKITFFEDGSVESYKDEVELACNLEWFNSSDKDEEAKIEDSLGRELLVVVEKLEVKECKVP